MLYDDLYIQRVKKALSDSYRLVPEDMDRAGASLSDVLVLFAFAGVKMGHYDPTKAAQIQIDDLPAFGGQAILFKVFMLIDETIHHGGSQEDSGLQQANTQS